MAKSLKKNCHKKRIGLTLIEVLIALAIIAISLAAVIKATSQNIRGTNYIEEKTLALWLAQNVINEIRLGILQAPARTDDLKSSQEMWGKVWYWQVNSKSTPNKHISKIAVNIFKVSPEEEEAQPLLTLEGFVNNEK